MKLKWIVPIAAIVGWLASHTMAEPSLAASAGELRQLGLSYRDQERYPDAIATLQQAVQLEPENLSGRVLLGWTLHKAGQQSNAAAVLQENVRRNPFDVPTLNALGIVYLVSGQLPDALTTHAWAALLKPTNEIAYYNLSLGLERLGQFNWAIVTAKEAALLEPSNPHPPVALALAHWGNGDRAAAVQAFQQAIALDGRYRDAEFLNYLNEAGFSADQIQRSKTVLLKSL